MKEDIEVCSDVYREMISIVHIYIRHHLATPSENKLAHDDEMKCHYFEFAFLHSFRFANTIRLYLVLLASRSALSVWLDRRNK